jgi:hypothetical protein
MLRWSGRSEQAEVSRLAWAFAISLAFHLLVYGGYHTGQKYHVWQRFHLPAWVHAPKILTDLIKKQPPPPLQRQDPPLMFVNVSPAQATAEAPKTAKYYSDKNSRAANPEADKITETPKITGKQTEIVKTEDIPREKFTPLQPSRLSQPPKEVQPPPPKPPKEAPPPTPEPPKEAQAEAKPKPAYTPGDLALAKPSPTPRKVEGDANEAKPPRPRTVRQALAQLHENQLPGEKIRQEGGVSRHAEMALLDTKATPFGEYDAALVEAISQRWFTLLDEREYASDSRGKVVLQFRLHYDGRITDMNLAENTAGGVLGLICEKAVLDPAPFAVWPSDMRRTLGDIRNIQFTFYYR